MSLAVSIMGITSEFPKFFLYSIIGISLKKTWNYKFHHIRLILQDGLVLTTKC